MITHDQLAYAFEQETGLTHGKDFLIAHPLGDDGKQSADAYVFQWKSETPQPAIETMLELAAGKYLQGFTANEVRTQRDFLLTQCDWTQNPDAPAAVKAAYVTYRQALRDLPEQVGFPLNVTWPSVPA
jgi:hypothetical protein